MSTAETTPCPQCGSTAHIPVVYGYPGSDLGSAAEQGRLVLGGCVIGPESEIALADRLLALQAGNRLARELDRTVTAIEGHPAASAGRAGPSPS